MNITNPKLLLW